MRLGRKVLREQRMHRRSRKKSNFKHETGIQSKTELHRERAITTFFLLLIKIFMSIQEKKKIYIYILYIVTRTKILNTRYTFLAAISLHDTRS